MNRLDELKIKHKGENNMNIQQAKELLPIIQAFAEGKAVQMIDKNGEWINCSCINFEFNSSPNSYCIKPESQYRPFKDTEECWQQMKKHEPFGWIRNKKTKEYELLQRVAPKNGVIDQYACAFKRWVFADGTPFGIKEE